MVKSFQAVSAFAESRRLPDAMYKVALSQYELKAFKNARATLDNSALLWHYVTVQGVLALLLVRGLPQWLG